MENINVELYIIGYTFIGIVLIWLYSWPLRIVGRIFKEIKGTLFNNNKGGGFF